MAQASSGKKAELKPKHSRNLRKYAKLLHGLGVNISEHVEKLELDENELKEIRANFGKGTFLKPKDRTALKLLVKKLFDIMRAYVKLEEELFEQVAPLAYTAFQQRIFAPDLISINALHELHNGLYQKNVAKLKTALPLARNLVLASMAQEHNKIYLNYPKLLRAVENVVSELAGIELQYANSTHEAKEDFSQLNAELRKILHEDVHFLTKDILRLYDLRIDIYNWIVKSDAEIKPHIVPRAEHELQQLILARGFYFESYRQHVQNTVQIYLGGAKA